MAQLYVVKYKRNDKTQWVYVIGNSPQDAEEHTKKARPGATNVEAVRVQPVFTTRSAQAQVQYRKFVD